MTDIAIIGAGAAGIAAARRLSELKCSYILLEAKNVIGGRCVTDTQTFGVPVDLGAHWLHSPALNPMTKFADAFGIRYSAQALSGLYSRDGVWLDTAEQEACNAYVEACFDRISAAGQSGQDGAIADLFAGHDGEPWHDVFLAELRAKQGVAIGDSSILDFARYVWMGDDWPVTDGYGTLLARLAEGLNIRATTPVRSIDWSGRSAIRIATADGTLEVLRVILAVPNSILAGGIDFQPLLPNWKRRSIADLPMGSCNKVTLRFNGRVFEDCPPSLVLPLRGASEAVEFVLRESGAEIATCLVNGPFAKGLAAAGGDARADYALERLAEIFGGNIRKAVQPQRIIADWDGDPFIRGCYSAARPGRADARLELGRPVEDRLFFAGEATSLDFAGDVHGAWFSGIAAAEAASASLRA